MKATLTYRSLILYNYKPTLTRRNLELTMRTLIFLSSLFALSACGIPFVPIL